MHSPPRYFVISAPRFDATTPLNPADLIPKGTNPGGGSYPVPTQNQPRVATTLTAPVGRFSIQSLLRAGNTAALVRVRCITPPEPGAYWQLRSAAAGEQTDPPPINQILAPSKALTQEWSAPVCAGTTDAIVIFHAPDTVIANPQIEIEVTEFAGDVAAAYLAAKAQCCSGESCVAANRDEVLGSEESLTLTPWECVLHLNVTAADAGTQVTLPLANVMASGASVLISRRGGAWFRVVAADGINGVVSPDGVIFESGAKAVLLQPTATGWSATDVIPDLAPVVVTTSPLGAFSGDAVRNIELIAGAVLVPPSTDLIAEGQTLYLTNTSTSEVTVRLSDPVTENFDGLIGLEYVLANRGDTLVLKRDGATGWRTSYNLFGRDARMDSAPANPLALPGYRGRRSYRFDSLAQVDITLPGNAVAYVGQQFHVSNANAGAIVVTAAAAQFIVGRGDVTATSVSLTRRDTWGYFEYEGSGIWSFQECCDDTQDRLTRDVTTQNSPLAVPALVSDVTIVAVTSDANTNELTLPTLAGYPDGDHQVLKIVNVGTTFSITLTPAVLGQTINSLSSYVLPAGEGVELQAFSATQWAMT